jgi:hypothetical protein
MGIAKHLKVTARRLCELASRLSASSSKLQGAGTFFFFLIISTVLYGRGVVGSPSITYVGGGHDPAGYIWSMVWWPYALNHHLNPFIARVIWEPVGFNLTWAAAIPGPSMVFWPITQCFGPVVSYNVLMILTPAWVAWLAFLLCKRASGQFYPAIVGGYLFGFSPYMLGHMLMGQPNLTLIFAVPLCAYLLLLLFDGVFDRATFVLALGIALTFQFLVSTEIVALITLFAGAAIAIGLVVLPTDQRRALLKTLPLIVLGYVVFAVAVSPYLYYAFAFGVPEQMHPIERCAADLLGYLVPSPMMLFGGKQFARFADTLTPHVWYGGKGIYTNPALITMFVLYVWWYWHTPVGKLLILSSLFVVVCSFGPQFHIADRSLMTFPWRWIVKIPTLNQALPVRFAMFFFLVISLVASIVLSDPRISKPLRISLAVLSILLAVPNRHYRLTVPQPVDTPTFFERPILEGYLKPNDTLLIFPFSIQGTSMLWQATSKMYFEMVGGYISTYVPPDYRRWPVVKMMLQDEPGPEFATQLKPFLANYHVAGIVISPEAEPKWRGPIDGLGIEPKHIGGVLFYSIEPPSEPRISTQE